MRLGDLFDAKVKRVGIGALSNLLSAAVIAVAPLVVLPVMLDYVGATNFGYWMAAAAASTLVFFVDFGIGSAMVSRVASMQGSHRYHEARRFVSTAYVCVSASATGAMVILVGVMAAVLSAGAHFEEWQVWTLVLAIAVVGVPAAFVQNVMNACHKEISLGIWRVIAALISVVVCLFSVLLGVSWIYVLAAYLSVMPLVMAVASVHFFRRNPEISPKFSLAGRAIAKDLFRSARGFGALSVLLAAAASVDVLLINSFVGPVGVAEYAVPAKLCGVVSLGIMAVGTPLWVVYGAALSRGERVWVVRNCLSVAIFLGACVLLLSVAASFLLGPVIDLWVGRSFLYQAETVGGLLFLAFVQAVTSPYNMALNSQNIVIPQLWCWGMYVSISGVVKVIVLAAGYPFFLLPIVGAVSYFLLISLPVAAVFFDRVARS